MTVPLRIARPLLLLAGLLAGLAGCATDREATMRRLDAMDSLALHAGPVLLHRLSGRRYYLLRPPCCDRADRLYDADGRYVCAPSGGFAGGGDGRCPPPLREALAKSKGEVVPNPFTPP